MVFSSYVLNFGEVKINPFQFPLNKSRISKSFPREGVGAVCTARPRERCGRPRRRRPGLAGRALALDYTAAVRCFQGCLCLQRSNDVAFPRSVLMFTGESVQELRFLETSFQPILTGFSF